MSSPVIWFGNFAKNLKNKFTFQNGVEVHSDVADPSSVATSGQRGSLALSSDGKLFLKNDNGTTTNWIELLTSVSGQFTEVAVLRAIKTDGTQGGGANSGSWELRGLNDQIGINDDFCSISSNQFTLDAGTYYIRGSAPAFGVNSHQTRIRNITDSTTALVGTSEFADTSAATQSRSMIEGVITIAASKTFELQHQVASTRATTGHGVRSTFSGETEVFAMVTIAKMRANTSREIAIIKDIKSDGTQGGTFTSGSFQTRDLNTIEGANTGFVSVSSNQFTLTTGTYQITAWAPAFNTQSHQAKIQNITDAAVELTGTPEFSDSSAGVTCSKVSGIFTITASKTFELQHQAGSTQATNGFGIRSTFSGLDEIYSVFEIERLAP